jgi:(S)-2-hydroxyglutarate dehydrogenase
MRSTIYSSHVADTTSPLASRSDTSGPGRVDLAVVGGGIVGLACAAELADRHPRMRVLVLERESEVGAHQTSHNSGVVHAGIYYTPGSLKARLCIEGGRLLAEFCEEHSLPFERVGKLIVARDDREIARLRTLMTRGQRNGVPHLRWLDSADIAGVESQAVGAAAIYSPITAITDFRRVARKLADVVRSRGGEIRTGTAVTEIREVPGGLELRHRCGAVHTQYALFSVGGWSDRLAVKAGASPDPRIIPFRGAYLEAPTEQRNLVHGLIYPVPDPDLPFLGVHLTRHIDGSLSVGPTAVLATSLRPEPGLQFDARVLARTASWPGTAKMAWRYRDAAIQELRAALAPQTVARTAAEYVPALSPIALKQGAIGVRAQAVARNGSLVDDFVFSRTPRALHVRNAPSPAATSALAIGRYVADKAQQAFQLS